MYNLVNNQKLHSQKGTIKFSLTKLVILETNNYLTNESNLNTTYLSSLQLAIGKGHCTDLQLWLDRNGVSLGTKPIRTWLCPTNERKQKKKEFQKFKHHFMT